MDEQSKRTKPEPSNIELRMRCVEAAMAEQSNWFDKLERAELLLAWVLSGHREQM